MGPIGFPEMMIILVVALIFFGPRKLPELGRSLGKSLNEFKRASNELRNTLDDEIRSRSSARPTTPTVADRPGHAAVAGGAGDHRPRRHRRRTDRTGPSSGRAPSAGRLQHDPWRPTPTSARRADDRRRDTRRRPTNARG